jgi:digeranylgeranylglycerophospholipid reductase
MQDAVIIGGGPAGSYTAHELAKRGLNTILFEEHNDIGTPSHCAGHLSIRSLRNLGLYPLPKGIVENEFSAANFHSPKGTVFRVQLSQPVTCSVNRTMFDRYLAENAQSAGTKIVLGTRVQSLLFYKGHLNGVRTISNDGISKEIEANLIVDAEGISSRILKQANLATLNGKEMVYAVEAEAENVKETETNAVEVFLGKDYAPGFYGWLIPRKDGTAKVGLGTKKGNPKNFLDRLLKKHPSAASKFQKAKIKHISFHAISLGGLIPKAYNDKFLAVGDCASQVKPTTGGGIIFGITCAKIAAEVAVRSFEKKDFSEEFLKLYQKHVKQAVGFDISVMRKVRKEINSYSDEQIDKAIRFADKVGLNKALRNINEIDFQGRMVISMLGKPAAHATLAYMLVLHLLKNA